MKITYTGPFAAVDVAGLVCKRGESVDVADDLGKSLLEQADNWEPVKAPPKKKETD